MMNKRRWSEVLDPMISESLGANGFERVSELNWVNSTDVPVRTYFHYATWQGMSIGPVWGLSLDFVPAEIRCGKPSWRRSARGYKGDVVIFDQGDDVKLSAFLDEGELLEVCRVKLAVAVEKAQGFYSSCSGLPGISVAFDHMKGVMGEKLFSMYPQVAMASDCLEVARSDDLKGAADGFCAKYDIDAHYSSKLQKLLCDAFPRTS